MSADNASTTKTTIPMAVDTHDTRAANNVTLRVSACSDRGLDSSATITERPTETGARRTSNVVATHHRVPGCS